MKIIHCADIHADSKMESHFSREQATERRNEIINSFAYMVRYAKENGVRAIIIAGDLFDTKESQQKNIKRRIAGIIKENTEIDFLYLRGNHDESVEFATDEVLSNLKRFSLSEWKCYSYGNVDIYGHEFGRSIPSSAYNQITPDSNKINIVVLHGQIAEYKTKEGAPVISLPKLKNRDIDYIALGHIHDYKKDRLDSRGSWCYPGCLAGRGFDECGKKGFVLLDITDKISSEFIPISQREIHDVKVTLDGTMNYNDIMSAICEEVKDISSRDIVKVDLVGDISEETEIEENSYLADLNSRYGFYFVRIKNSTKPMIDYEKYENDVSLKGEFIRLVKSQTDLSDEDKARVIVMGIRALAGRTE